MLVELNGKAGKVCEYARQGVLRCPLIVRPTSEDQITGEIFQTLRAINSRYWLSQLLNKAVGAHRFRQQVFRRLKIRLWERQPLFPRHLLPWNEGCSEIDAIVEFENPPTTIFIEMKFGAELSRATVGGRKQTEFPSDQLIRNIRIGLWRTGWIQEPSLFERTKRDLGIILISPNGGNELVRAYRDLGHLTQSLPCRDHLIGIPRTPFIGELSYQQIIDILRSVRKWVTWQERILIDDLCNYLVFKLRLVNDLGSKKAGTEQ